MNSLIVFLSPLAVLLPAMMAGDAPPAAAPASEVARASERQGPMTPFAGEAGEPFRIVQEARKPPVEYQVRIEQRVIIRISPGTAALRERMLAGLPRRSSTNTYEEQRLRGCIPIEAIAAVQPAQDNRLLLFMHDRRVLTAALERSCKAEDFYSGFYVERSEDGQICARRDELRSRSGAHCRVSQLNRLVAVRD